MHTYIAIMSDGNVPISDHDTIVEMRTDMKYIRAELMQLNGTVADISKMLAPMPGRMDGTDQRIAKSEMDMHGVADALNRHISEGERHADKRITRMLALMLVVASLTGGGIATIIEFLIRHG